MFVLVVASPATATVPGPGPNGPLAFTSGRDLGDANAQIWLIGGASPTIRLTSTLFNAYQHRHPTWSPDRTMIAYGRCRASGCGAAGPHDIVIQDLVQGSTINITALIPGTGSADRPSFSPDGNWIAYGRQDGTNWNIYKQPVNNGSGGTESPVATTTDNEEKPSWSADSQQVFYQRLVAANDRDIYRSPAGGGTAVPIITGTEDDYQPAVSPDGQSLCFVRGAFGSNNAEVKRSTLAGGNIQNISPIDGVGSYNCAWSPDGTKIAYANGTFGSGALVTRSSDGTGGVSPVTDCVTPTNTTCFDGNPDWTYNPSPTCPDGNASVAFNSFVSIPISCSDVPEPGTDEPQSVDEEIVSPPANGVLGSLNNGQVIYTPNVNFQGQDSFTFKGSDGTSDSNVATIAVTVAGPAGGGGGGGGGPTPTCGGQTATIVGTAGIDVIAGTRRRDVIAALGGNDTVRAGRGNDLICAGSGRDRVAGGGGKDRASGGTGGDRLLGNGGNDALKGNGGRDRLIGGRGRDRLNGGAARDVCIGSLGSDRASRCERRIGIP